jgi:lipopolysaccharide export system protein LptC
MEFDFSGKSTQRIITWAVVILLILVIAGSYYLHVQYTEEAAKVFKDTVRDYRAAPYQ